MCVIIWAPSGKVPLDQIIRSMNRHPHGWGFAVATGKNVLSYKSVNPDRFLDAWKNRVKGPVLFHARWATHGPVVTANCHPFTLKGHGMVAAHNGIIPGFGRGEMSDTRHFVEEVLCPMPKWFLEDSTIKDNITSLLQGSKLVLLDKWANVEILNEALGLWHQGRWYSNTSALTVPTIPLTR